jgi:hypothetical protein
VAVDNLVFRLRQDKSKYFPDGIISESAQISQYLSVCLFAGEILTADPEQLAVFVQPQFIDAAGDRVSSRSGGLNRSPYRLGMAADEMEQKTGNADEIDKSPQPGFIE